MGNDVRGGRSRLGLVNLAAPLRTTKLFGQETRDERVQVLQRVRSHFPHGGVGGLQQPHQFTSVPPNQLWQYDGAAG